MKVKVIMPFNDKESGKVRNIGEVFDVTQKRFDEIKKAGRFVVAVEQEEKPAKETEKK
jgi:hypothetical protein